MNTRDEILIRADAICQLAGVDPHDVDRWSLIKGAVLNLVDDVRADVIALCFDRMTPLVEKMVADAVEVGANSAADAIIEHIKNLSKEA